MRLEKKVAIVTGSASGIGRAIALAFANEGANVVICDINVEGAKAAADEIKKLGYRALAVKADISKENEVKQMAEKTIREFGQVDILVNNAGFVNLVLAPFHETDTAEWGMEIDTTFIGQLLCCKAVIPYMIKQQSGRIINIVSTAGKIGVPYMALYSACKAAVAGFSRAIAKELAIQGITVNCISPGNINTPAMARAMEIYKETMLEGLKLAAMAKLGEPEDIANMAVFLASDDANYITGQNYSVDGGLCTFD